MPKETETISLFVISVDGMLVKEALSRIWFDSWMWKWNNTFNTCVAGLAFRLQLRLQDRTILWSGELIYSVPYGKEIPTGNRVWVWDWCNELCTRIVCAKPHKTVFFFPAQSCISLLFLIAQYARTKRGWWMQ